VKRTVTPSTSVRTPEPFRVQETVGVSRIAVQRAGSAKIVYAKRLHLDVQPVQQPRERNHALSSPLAGRPPMDKRILGSS
jgi:hypothetical protein